MSVVGGVALGKGGGRPLQNDGLIDEQVAKFMQLVPKHDKYRMELHDGARRLFEETCGSLEGASRRKKKRALRNCFEDLMLLDLDDIKRELVKDEAYELFEECSARVFELARQTLMKGDKVIDDVDSEFVLDNLRVIRDSVLDFNRKRAAELFSETAMDVALICRPGSEYTSIRIGEIIERLPDDLRVGLYQKALANQARYDAEEASATISGSS